MKKSDDRIAIWQETYGQYLANALRWLEVWRFEARGDGPRELTYQELKWRCGGDLSFDGEAYAMSNGVAEVIAHMGTPGLLQVASATELDEVLGPLPRLDYELACQIAGTNKAAGRKLPRCLEPFAGELARQAKRPRGRDEEALLLTRTLARWGVDRAVGLGLAQGRTRSDKARNPRGDRAPCATELVVSCFVSAGWTHITYNMVNEAWQAQRHRGNDGRKLTVKSHAPVHTLRFSELDQLLKQLPEFAQV
ncbi:hypothetical protein [Roseicyclus persicicus]|uniref:Uncharacterized protein n=1 Tax=Roseicyclus persicicus TaxID=2650661 RepID=A0A7X6JXK6_9RHOB|nr:hypothetical protein [Roseibacterium persicicum]NKX44880.1 hypothetical protein [Roseibacterium persicicum]